MVGKGLRVKLASMSSVTPAECRCGYFLAQRKTLTSGDEAERVSVREERMVRYQTLGRQTGKLGKTTKLNITTKRGTTRFANGRWNSGLITDALIIPNLCNKYK